jgi:signal transduction histidine kinase
MKVSPFRFAEKQPFRRRPHSCSRTAALRWIPQLLLLLWASGSAGYAQVAPKPLAILTQADQVRKLSPEQAARGYPVRVRGVVTGDVPSPDFFVQDSTAGVYVEGNQTHLFPHRLGDMVEIEGITGPGKFAPVIREQKLRVLGKGSLPQAKLYSFSEFSDGQLDSQWARVRGIVRSVSIDRTSWQEITLAMRVVSGAGEFAVRVPIPREGDFSSWIDREVLIEGVCGSRFNYQRQLSGVLFYVPRLSFIKVDAPAEEVPFSALLRFSPTEGVRHRVRVRGVVTYQQPGSALFLQAQGRGLRVLSPQDTRLEIGDVVDAMGFPVMGESAPVLTDAVFHRIEHSDSPAPVKLDLSAPWEQYDGALITTDATLLGRQLQAGGLRLVLRTGDNLFDATVQPADLAARLSSIPLNSEVRISGICLVRSGGMWALPQSFRVLVRSPQDALVLRAPSWWNLRHTLWLLGITAAILLLVLAWVVVLGGRLREQMSVLRQKLQHGAVLEERNRIARELHDNLEQELAGISMQLDLAADCFQQAPQIAHQAVQTARNMSRHSMIEARRSVWDLRCHLLEKGDLGSALAEIVQPLLARNGSKIDVRITGRRVRLPGSVEMNLLRIGQEAVANAVQHGHARNIEISLEYEDRAVRLCVSDDGCGFCADQNSSTGHFGLLDMRERAHSMGSSLRVESQPGQGARIAVEVPVKDSWHAHEKR